MVKQIKQFVDNLPTSCLSVFDLFVGLALKKVNKSLSQIEHGIIQITACLSTIKNFCNPTIKSVYEDNFSV